MVYSFLYKENNENIENDKREKSPYTKMIKRLIKVNCLFSLLYKLCLDFPQESHKWLS